MSNITPLNPRRAPTRPVLITLEGVIVRSACRVIDLECIAKHHAEQTDQRARLRCSGWDWMRKAREEHRS